MEDRQVELCMNRDEGQVPEDQGGGSADGRVGPDTGWGVLLWADGRAGVRRTRCEQGDNLGKTGSRV